METAAPRRPPAAPRGSQLPRPRPGLKRTAAAAGGQEEAENVPPPEPLQKRSRGGKGAASRPGRQRRPDPRAALGAAAPPAAGKEPAGRSPRLTRPAGSFLGSRTAGRPPERCAFPPAAPPAAAAAGKEKKRPPWDLKGQVGDLRVKLGAWKEKGQALAGENEALRSQLGALRQELSHSQAQEKELSCRTRLLDSELQLSQAQAREGLRKVMELLAKEQRLEQTLQAKEQTICLLESKNQEIGEGARNLAVQLGAREEELLMTRESLAHHRQQSEDLAAQAALLERKLHECEMQRRVLHNTVEELKGNIRVFCRVRPLLAWEKQAEKGSAHLRFPADNNRSLVLCRAGESHVGRERRDDITYDFTFDRVFPPASSQEGVFEEISLLIQSALDGYHVCIFAYGQTGSGKTYTMEGTPEAAGVIPRAVRQIFATAHEMGPKGWKYQFTANMLEIYNEALRDLLAPQQEQNGDLEIRRVSQYTEELHVPNLCYVPVSSEEEVLQLLQTAGAHRSVAKTCLNERSSRSHSLFQFRIEGRNTQRDLSTSSVLSLVDLAGSERLDKSLSCGERLKETQAINSSLSSLGLVITALCNKEAHVPYRNSKLTYLLQNSLGGNSKMLMFVNISPLEENFGESLNSLRFARKVNECVIGTASGNRK